jgi:hypothetical protein
MLRSFTLLKYLPPVLVKPVMFCSVLSSKLLNHIYPLLLRLELASHPTRSWVTAGNMGFNLHVLI